MITSYCVRAMWVIVDVGPTQEGCSDYLSEDSRIAALMAEYAEKDEYYEGGATEDGGPPRPMLMYAQVFVVLASKHKGLRGRAPMQRLQPYGFFSRIRSTEMGPIHNPT